MGVVDRLTRVIVWSGWLFVMLWVFYCVLAAFAGREPNPFDQFDESATVMRMWGPQILIGFFAVSYLIATKVVRFIAVGR